MLRYPVKLEREDGAILVSFPDFPGVQTFGGDRAEALVRAVDALETMLMGLIEDRQPIPRPRRERLRESPEDPRIRLSCRP